MATLTEAEKEQAEEAAEEVIRETFTSLEAVEFPIDLDAVLDKYALKLKKGNFENDKISGAFSREDSTVFVSENESLERQLFTVAHEIGHYMLHKSRKTEILYREQVWQFGNGYAKDETQANWFAASLLMPKAAIQRMWKVTKDVSKLSAIFGVSKAAMYFRLKDLGLLSK